jgi:hypothetical protein
VRRAVEACQSAHVMSAEAVIERTRGLAASESQASCPPAAIPDSIAAPRVDVPLPDLSRFNQLLGGSVDRDELPDEALGVPADVAAPEGRSNVSFAR